MRCPFCNADQDKVIDSRSSEAGKVIRRRRQCNQCNRRFTTYERAEDTTRLTVIKRDGVEISRSFSRHVVAPDADITGESTEVQAICAAVHTQAVKDAYAAHLAAQAAEMAPAEGE